jgi:hypothetical protein
MDLTSSLKGSVEWIAAIEGKAFETLLSPLEVLVPGGGSIQSSGLLRWDPIEGLSLDIPFKADQRMPHRESKPGEPLTSDDFFGIACDLGNGVSVQSGMLMDDSPQSELGIPVLGQSVGGRILRFRPNHIAFVQQKHRSILPVATREGILQCPTDLPWRESEHVETKSPMGGVSETRWNCDSGQLASGFHFLLRAISKTQLHCRISGPDNGQLPGITKHLETGLGIATGAHCAWLSWSEESKEAMQIFFTNPIHTPGFRLAPIDRGVPDGSLLDFLRLLSEACAVQSDLLNEISAVSLCWTPPGTFLEIIILISCCVLEYLATTQKDRIPGANTIPPPPLEEIEKLKKVLSEAPFEEQFRSRLKGMTSHLHESRASDVLFAVAKTAPYIISEEEAKSWKSLRNTFAHGRFENNDPALMRKTAHVFNMINKIVFCMVKYRGIYRDYQLPNWGHNRFFPELKPTPPTNCPEGAPQPPTNPSA